MVSYMMSRMSFSDEEMRERYVRASMRLLDIHNAQCSMLKEHVDVVTSVMMRKMTRIAYAFMTHFIENKEDGLRFKSCNWTPIYRAVAGDGTFDCDEEVYAIPFFRGSVDVEQKMMSSLSRLYSIIKDVASERKEDICKARVFDSTINILEKGYQGLDDFVENLTLCIELEEPSRKMYVLLNYSSTLLKVPSHSMKEALDQSSASRIMDFSAMYISIESCSVKEALSPRKAEVREEESDSNPGKRQKW